MEPCLIVCDEPVSALDVSIRSQILNLLLDLQEELDLTYLFVAHDLSVIEHVSDVIAVMYLGKIVECAPTDRFLAHTLHPYSEALLSAVPVPEPTVRKQRTVLSGDVPSPLPPRAGAGSARAARWRTSAAPPRSRRCALLRRSTCWRAIIGDDCCPMMAVLSERVASWGCRSSPRRGWLSTSTTMG